jgi:enoyl-[acyl-carrier protein] reductase II
MIQTRLTELLGIQRPIIQGGLQHLAKASLCAAVCQAGGLGQLTAAAFPSPEDLRREIHLVRQQTDRPFAVNFAIGHRDLTSLLDVALDEGVRIITVTGGNPEPFFRQADAAGVGKVMKLALVASVRQARKVEEMGGDAVIAVGFEGGGHIGRDDIGSMVLIPRIVDSVHIPVVASGGIGDGRGLVAALALGADGIEMGTRFVVTKECPAAQEYKEALVRASETDTIVIERRLGRPGRVLRTPYTEAIMAKEAAASSVDELVPLISGEANYRAAVQGDLDNGFVWAGQVVGLVNDIPTVRELMDRIMAEAEAIISQLNALLR